LSYFFEDKTELKEIMDVYVDTWGKMVKTLIFKRFQHNNEIIYSINPEFNDIDFSALEYSNESTELKNPITEDFHFDKVRPETKAIYDVIKSDLLSWDREIGFNPQKYYISLLYNRNVAYFITRKSKIRLVLKANVDKVRELIKHHHINEFSKKCSEVLGR
jgi:predicted transport protein